MDELGIAFGFGLKLPLLQCSRLRKSVVSQLEVTLMVNHNILGFNVPVDHPVIVQTVDGHRYLCQQGSGLVLEEPRLLRQSVGEVSVGGVLHDEVVEVALSERVDCLHKKLVVDDREDVALVLDFLVFGVQVSVLDLDPFHSVLDSSGLLPNQKYVAVPAFSEEFNHLEVFD